MTNELVSKSTDFPSFRVNILNKLRGSKDASEIEALILMDYSVQIVENSGLHSRASSLSWNCIATTIGFFSTSVMMDTPLRILLEIIQEELLEEDAHHTFLSLDQNLVDNTK